MNEKNTNEFLSVVQAYAIHYASQQVQFVCRHKSKVDLNTTTLLSSTITSESEEHSTSIGNTERVLQHVYGSQLQFTSFDCKQQDESPSECTYSCHGMISTTPQKKTSLILFCNDRLVECPPLKKLINEVIKVPCICYISISLPPTQVDVNVHPTKKHVTMLYQDKVLNAIQTALGELAMNQPQSFASASVQVVKNPYNKTKKRKAESQQNDDNVSRPKPSTKKTTTVAPNALVRTTRAAPAGAIEPFLVKTTATTVNNQSNINKKTHVSSCPLSDLSTPGAFAQQCTCPLVNTTSNRMVRPKRIIPSKCTYSSIQSLREKLLKHSSKYSHIKNMLREAVWVGHVPQTQQCLIQVGVELWMWNYRDLGQQLFYQLALLQFGGLRAATFKERIDVTKIMAFAMELEEGNDDDNVADDSDRQFTVVEQEYQLGARDTSNTMLNGAG